VQQTPWGGHFGGGAVQLAHLCTARIESVPDGDTNRIATITVLEPTALWIVFDVGAALDIAVDGTAAAVAPDGALALGLTAPDAADPSGTHTDAAWSTVTDAEQPTLALTLPDDASYPIAVTVHLGASAVAATEWGTNEGGESLAVTPRIGGASRGPSVTAMGRGTSCSASRRRTPPSWKSSSTATSSGPRTRRPGTSGRGAQM
jgi:hypothetical protein